MPSVALQNVAVLNVVAPLSVVVVVALVDDFGTGSSSRDKIF